MSEITHQPAENHGEHEHHVTPPIVYIIVFAILLVCTGLTVGASYIEMGVFNRLSPSPLACSRRHW